MTRIHLFLCLAFLFCITRIQAQPGGIPKGMNLTIGRIYGKIIDKENKKPVGYASITISRQMGAVDSIINGALSEENGDFNIENLPLGPLTVKVSFLGFKETSQRVTLTMPDNLEIDLGNIPLEIEFMQTDAVEITAEKSNVVVGIDKRVFNVGRNLTAIGGTAEDVLKSVPAVTVDSDGNALLRNNGATVYVDGRPTQMTLNQIPADMIDQVEVMTNPSVKYEAGITGGMINIVLKRNKKPGYNGFVSAGVGTGNRYNLTANLNLRQGKWNFGTFYNLTKNGFPVAGYTHRTTLSNGEATSYFNQDNRSIFRNQFQMGRINVDYSVNNRNTLTLAMNYNAGRFNVSDSQYFEILDANKQLVTRGTRSVLPNNEHAMYSGQLTWRKLFPKKDKEWTSDITYGLGGGKNYSEWVTLNYDAAGILLPNSPELQKITGASSGKQITFQSDFVNPLNDSTKIEFGVRSFWDLRTQNMLIDYKNELMQEYVQLTGISQDLDIRNVINAGYINYSSRWKGVGYQAGLRYEQTNFLGKSLLQDTTFGYNFPKDISGIWKGLFPALYISKKFDASNELQLNFTRKINRPGHMQIMPVIFMADRQNIRKGNPLLEPEFVNTLEMNYNKIWEKSNWLSSIYYRIEENPIVNYVYTSPEDSTVLINTFTNGENTNRYGWDNTFKTQLNKSLDFTFNANIYNLRVVTTDLNRQGWAGSSKLIINYKFPDSWAIKIKQKPMIRFSSQLTGSYESRQIIPQGYRKSVPTADFALKAELSKIASLTFSVNDIPNMRRMAWVYEMPTYTQEMMRRRDTRYFKVALQFMFGKPDASLFKKGKSLQKMQQNQGNQGDMF